MAADGGQQGQTVSVVGSGNSVTLSTNSVPAGTIHFNVSTTAPSGPDGGGSNIVLFQPKSGKTVADLFAGIQEEFSKDSSTAAKGTRDLNAAMTFRGLADVQAGTPVVVTESLKPGTYYLVDFAGVQQGGKPAVSTLTVTAGQQTSAQLPSQVQVRTAGEDRFAAPPFWPNKGTYTFTNSSDTLHFMTLQPVKDGTTDADVKASFEAKDQNGPPAFAKMGPSIGNEVVSPGYSLQMSYDLPAGTYVLLCFVADDKTGVPHAVMGMHKVVELRSGAVPSGGVAAGGGSTSGLQDGGLWAAGAALLAAGGRLRSV
ncbi:MAG: hypothetical protein M3Z00_04695, partial [Actinomycetota bacterium]|nr:hypothetical protein [Actinomycetota bacterium]